MTKTIPANQIAVLRELKKARVRYLYSGAVLALTGSVMVLQHSTAPVGLIMLVLGVGAIAIYVTEFLRLRRSPDYEGAITSAKAAKAQVDEAIKSAAAYEKDQLARVASANAALKRFREAGSARAARVSQLEDWITNLSDVRGKRLMSAPGGITIYERWISTPQISGTIVGVHASSEDNTSISKRITATRIVALGVFALAAKKSKAEGQAYCVFDGPEVAGVVIFPANKTIPAGPQAARLASLINVQAKKAEKWMASKDVDIEAAKRELVSLESTPVGVAEEQEYMRLLAQVDEIFRAKVV